MDTLNLIARMILNIILIGVAIGWVVVFYKESKREMVIRLTRKDIENIADELQARENGRLSKSKEIDEIMKP